LQTFSYQQTESLPAKEAPGKPMKSEYFIPLVGSRKILFKPVIKLKK
jgi:hypothetical protein